MTSSFSRTGTATRSRTTRVFYASTLYGAATLTAAIDAGLFAPADRTVLVVSNNAGTPELTPAVHETPGFRRLRHRFDDVLSWNETIAPFHPGGWVPREDDLPIWERHLRLAWGLGDDTVELVLESIQVSPALTLAEIFTAARIEVYADGLMSYGPTRNRLDLQVGARIRRLLHLDLVPGLVPLLLTEFGVPSETVPTSDFLRVLDQLADSARDFETPAVAPALLLGQYLSTLGIITEREEEELHLRMLRGVVGLGHRNVVFKPHPTAPAIWSRRLEEEAAKLDAELTVLDSPVLAEVLYQRLKPALVVGCFSTALFTASAFYGVPVARVGTDMLLDRLSPYQNSNRVPVTLVDALVPPLDDDGTHRPEPEPSELVAAVGFVMQPQMHPGLRAGAESFLAARLDPHTLRYFKRRRLTTLGLPGAVGPQLVRIPQNAAAQRVVRRARRLRRAVLRLRA
ncbi:polysialyltransferase family glycosyltransferase [Streptomyces sp. NPDC058653]|uniref:polysialyltransferase family glycosyltransferase n=1 Tax=Streptomyces sp. NPDC058653 TaxID=3346576 RepID=UPI0036653EBE